MWTEPILHVDMDSFFVEVERLNSRDLVGRPVAVGGTGRRGVIASASYEAREFGVRSAQPTVTALRLCPSLVVLPPSRERYSEKSVEVFSVFRSVTPLVEGLSLDEAFLDVSGLTRHFDSPVDVARHVRAKVRTDTGLPSSVGVASSKFMAKLASEHAKPDGLHHVPHESRLEFLRALPASSLPGVGPATLAALLRLGVETIGDIAALPVSSLRSALGATAGSRLFDLARGIDARRVEPDSVAKSISVEETYDRDLVGGEVVKAAALALAQRLSYRLRRSGVAALTVSIKVRHDDFTTLTRSTTLPRASASPRDLYQSGLELVGLVDVNRPIRLLGLAASSLVGADTPVQLALGDDGVRQEPLEDALATIRDRFGPGAVRPARLVAAPDQPDDLGPGD